VTWMWKLNALWDAFEISLLEPSSSVEALEFGRRALEICQCVFHPQSDRPVEMQETLNNPRLSYSLHNRIAAQSA